MDPFEMVVAIVAMSLGYKIMSEFISGRRESRRNKQQHREQVVVHEEPGELTSRAENLTRRLATLEEILAADRRS